MAVGIGLASVLPFMALPLPVGDGFLGAVQGRMAMGLDPLVLGLLPGLFAIVAQEVLFRGWLQRLLGAPIALALFVLILGPLDPLGALWLGAPLALLTVLAKGSIWPAVLARWMLALFPAML
jgi:hypothetical protein